MKILMLIRELSVGGAERQLAVLARGLAAAGHEVQVAVFYGGGALEADLSGTGLALFDLRKSGRWDTFGFMARFAALLRRERPDVVYSFLTGGNLVAGALGRFVPGCAVAWGLAASGMDLSRYDWLVRFSSRLEARLGFLARIIVANSEAGRRHALDCGFPAAKLRVVRNGIDTGRFRPDRAAGLPLRRAWKVGEKDLLVGLVGRLDPVKGHPDFLRMAAMLRRDRPGLRFVCVGDGPESYRRELLELSARLDLADSLIWAGSRADIPAVYNALDILVSSSLSEGLPNTVAEAMACGVPCVVTDVGDSAWLVNDFGIVVPPAGPEALAAGAERLLATLEMRGAADGERARAWIEAQLSVDALVRNTLAILETLA